MSACGTNVLFLAALLVLVGCDAEDACQVQSSDGKVYDCDPEAQQKCELLVTAYCDRVAECSWFVSEGTCMVTVSTQLDCAPAVAVSDTYQGCLQDINSFDCDALESSLPSSCEGAVLVTESTTVWTPASDEDGYVEPGTDASNPDEPDPDKPDPPDSPTPTVWDYSYRITSLSLTVAKYKPNGDNWDSFGGAPDLFVDLYVDGNYSGSVGTKEDTFDATWNSPGVTLDFTSSSKLLFKVFDKDLAADDGVNELSIQGSQLKGLLTNGWLELNSPAESVERIEVSVVAE